MISETEREFVKNTNNKTVDYIKSLIGAYYEVDTSVFNSKKRNIESVKPRHMAIYMVKKNTNKSFSLVFFSILLFNFVFCSFSSLVWNNLTLLFR
jgi:chromosomal replication initiation ATPase DnaA